MLKKGKIKSNKFLTDDVFELAVSLDQEFNFAAGQFITIKINDATPPCFRAYSIASAPENGKTIDVTIKVVTKDNGEKGRGSSWLAELKENDEIEFLGPSGKFLFETPKDKKAIFVATGTGVAPFRSMIEEQLNAGSTQPMHLIFGVRHEKDIFYKDLFEDLAAKHDNFTFDLTLSRPEDSWKGSSGRVTEHVKNYDTKNSQVYICGLNDMIQSVVKILEKKGLTEEDIHFEKYD